MTTDGTIAVFKAPIEVWNTIKATAQGANAEKLRISCTGLDVILKFQAISNHPHLAAIAAMGFAKKQVFDTFQIVKPFCIDVDRKDFESACEMFKPGDDIRVVIVNVDNPHVYFVDSGRIVVGISAENAEKAFDFSKITEQKPKVIVFDRFRQQIERFNEFLMSASFNFNRGSRTLVSVVCAGSNARVRVVDEDGVNNITKLTGCEYTADANAITNFEAHYSLDYFGGVVENCSYIIEQLEKIDVSSCMVFDRNLLYITDQNVLCASVSSKGVFIELYLCPRMKL